ncbi:MAG: DUF6090 family protein [Gemmatimonadota bacterium]|nr:DUF6090 family protein [Gemmatimonadota bacterium]
MSTGGLPWKRLAAEAVVIVASVYLAIGLEGQAQDRERKKEATAALAQLRDELRQDRVDIGEVRAEQESNARHYERLMRWLAEPSSMPADSVQVALDQVVTSNRTMFPRSSAWTTMVASGQLTELENPELVTRLGNLYENINDRLIYNGEYYDSDLSTLAFGSIVTMWDSRARRLLTRDPIELAVFSNRLRFMYHGWNQYYLALLDEYEAEVEALIGAVSEHLAAHGWESP